MATVTENKRSKRSRILDAAFGLFTDKSVSNTAIDDVVKQAGVAKGTFYLYFKDKYDLLNQILIHHATSALRDGFDTVRQMGDGLTFPEEMRALTDYMLDYLAKNKKLAALLHYNLPAFLRTVTKLENEELDYIRGGIRTVCAENGYDAETAGKLLYLMLHLIGSVGCEAILYGVPYTLDDIRPILYHAIELVLTGKK